MEDSFLKGVSKAVAYYGVGFIVSWIAYLIFGKDYIHGPGLHHLIGLLVIAVGALIVIVKTIGLFRKTRNRSHYGSLIIHLLVITGFIIYINSLGNSQTEIDGIDDVDSDELTFDKTNKTIVIKNGLGDTTFIQVSDSVIINNEGIKK